MRWLDSITNSTDMNLSKLQETVNETGMLQSAAAAKSLQSCPTLCDPRDSSPPGSSIHGIFQATVLESMGSQKVRHYLVTEQQIFHYVYVTSLFIHPLVKT